jgi:hypothetical protein
MKQRLAVVLAVAGLVGIAVGSLADDPWSRGEQRPLQDAGPASARVEAAGAARAGLKNLPPTFVANEGQFDSRVSWAVAGSEATAYFLNGAVRWALPGRAEKPGWAVDQTFVGARSTAAKASIVGSSHFNYFVGQTHRTGVSTAAELVHEDAWPGVDIVWSGKGASIETTYRVAPGADPDQVRVAWTGASSISVTNDGRLAVETPARTFEEDAPIAFQEVDGGRVAVEVAYELTSPTGYGFRLGTYDPTRPLVIDPTVLLYSSFLGGGGDDTGEGIAVDPVGNAYVTGSTTSDAGTFPETPGAFQSANTGSASFVAKVDPTGSSLLYATFVGGSLAAAIAVDSGGSAYVTGDTISTYGTFPVTAGVFQTSNAGSYDAFVIKLNPAGSGLIYATFLGGNLIDGGGGIAVDAAGNAYVGGRTESGSNTFPETSGVFQPENGGGSMDAFVAKVNPTGTALLYASFLGGSNQEVGTDIAIDQAGNSYVTGITQSTAPSFPVTAGAFQTQSGGSGDAFVAKVNPTGTMLLYSSFLGGENWEVGEGIAIDGAGSAYLTGYTGSTAATFPETPGAFQIVNSGSSDAFVVKVNPSGSALVYASFLGGINSESGQGIAVDGAGNAYVTGYTDSTAATFPVVAGAFQRENAGGADAFVAKVNPAGTNLLYSGFLGGRRIPNDLGESADAANGIAIDAAGHAFVTGYTSSVDNTFPTTPGAFQTTFGGPRDAFVVKIGEITRTPSDFDGDGDTDIAVYRPATNEWFGTGQGPFSFGAAGDVPVPADYDGDGKTEVAVFRPSTGAWLRDGGPTTFLGLSGDVPVPCDYDADGKADISVFRPSTGAWFRGGEATVFFGLSGDIPVPSDYDGDGDCDIAVFRPSTGGWHRMSVPTVYFGLSGDIPVPAEYDATPGADIAIFRPSAGGWYRIGATPEFLGLSGDVPVPGAYSGGPAQLAVFRSATGAWFVAGASPVYFGLSGDVALPLPAAVQGTFFP